MTLDKPSAAEALAEIGQSQRRSASLYSYRISAPYLLLTGAMWLTGDLLFEFTEFGKHWGWPIVSLASIPVFIAIGVFQSRRRTAEGAPAGRLDSHFWKGIGLWLVLFALAMGVITIFGPVNGMQVHSLIGLMTGLAYVTMGLWMGWRYLAIGLAIAGLTMLGHFMVHEHYTAFMGVVGGGGMMLGALWMRRV